MKKQRALILVVSRILTEIRFPMTPIWFRKTALCLVMVLVAMLTVAGTHGSRAKADIAFQYSFNAGSSTAAVDSSSQRLTGQIRGARPIKPVDGYALKFDGKDDYVAANSAFSSLFNNGKKRWINYLATVVTGHKIA